MHLQSLPVDVLRHVLQLVLGDAPLDAYQLMPRWQSFALVCKAWRIAALTTPLRLNLEYLPALPTPALRWILRVTVADLQVPVGEGEGEEVGR